MSPDAAELFAQIDATLLVALAVQGRPPEQPEMPDSPGDQDFPRRLWESTGVEAYTGGLLATVISLAMTLASVRYDKPLGALSSSVVSGATLWGMLAFFLTAAGRAIGQYRTLLKRLKLVAAMSASFIAFAIWLLTFAPSFWPWE